MFTWTIAVYMLFSGSYVQVGTAGHFSTYAQCEKALVQVQGINPSAAYACEDEQGV